MATKLHLVEKRDGIASIIVGVFVAVVLLLVGVALTTYNQFVAGRQVVTTTATGALRSAVPAGFLTETVATSKSKHAHGLVVDPVAYDVAVGQALPSFWSGAQVQLCTTTPQGSPVTCTPGNSFLVTLPTVTAQDLHIAGPLIVANVQLVTSPPYKVTHFGHTTTLAQPAVAADVTYPVDISVMGLNFHVWAEQAITNSLYADQGGNTGGSSRYLAFGATPNQGSGDSTTTITCGSWHAPSYYQSILSPCTTRPAWCPVNATACALQPFSAPNGGFYSGKLNSPALGNLEVVYLTSGSFFPQTAQLPPSYGPLWASYVASHSPSRPTGNYCWLASNGAGVTWQSDLSPNSPYSPMPQECVTPPASNIPSWVTSISTPGTLSGSQPSWLCYGNPQLHGSGSTVLWVCGNPPS